MNKLSKSLLILFFSVVLIQNSSFIVQAVEDSTGADEIFELIGVEKPEDWVELGRTEKQEFLSDHGAYPPEEGKYEGKVDLDRYFEELGIVQPEGWLTMSVEQRVEYINNLESGDGDKMGVDSLPSQSLPDQAGEDLTMEKTVEVMEIQESVPNQIESVVIEPEQGIAMTTWLYGGVFVVSLFGLIVLVIMYKKDNY